jgi:carbamoyltransferase
MLILGLSNMRDVAAALVENGRVIAAAEEERFVRIKHVTALPVQAIRYCLRAAGVRLCDIDGVAVPSKYWLIGRRGALAFGAMLRSPQLCWVKGKKSVERVAHGWKELAFLRGYLTRQINGTACPTPVFLDHHLCHAASTVLVSPFEEMSPHLARHLHRLTDLKRKAGFREVYTPSALRGALGCST